MGSIQGLRIHVDIFVRLDQQLTSGTIKRPIGQYSNDEENRNGPHDVRADRIADDAVSAEHARGCRFRNVSRAGDIADGYRPGLGRTAFHRMNDYKSC